MSRRRFRPEVSIRSRLLDGGGLGHHCVSYNAESLQIAQRRGARTDLQMPENFIAGTWVAAQEGGRREIRCPADGELVAEIDESTRVDTEAAIAAARDRVRRRPLAGHQRPRAWRPAAPRGRPAPARQGRPRPDGVAGHRQAARRERARHRRRHQRLPSLRPGRRRRRRSGRRHRPRRRGQPGGARAGRGVRPDHPVELPVAAGLLEGRAGARGRLHVRAQAQRALARTPPST